MAAKASLEKLLGSLTEDQISLLREYYIIQRSSLILDDELHERLCTIWEEAQFNSALCRQLELIDDICSNPLEEETEHEKNLRSYWAEYLIPHLDAKLNQKLLNYPEIDSAIHQMFWRISLSLSSKFMSQTSNKLHHVKIMIRKCFESLVIKQSLHLFDIASKFFEITDERWKTFTRLARCWTLTGVSNC